MDEVDYLKLCEQYVNFLIASVGVSITVLTLVLTFGFKSETQGEQAKEQNRPAKKEVDLRSFLVAALIVSTVYCFIGAQMMTETAGFFSYKYPSAKTTSSKPFDKENPPPQTPSNSEPPKERSPEDIEFGERLFLLASTNIFITVVLLLFALMLLPKASKTVEPNSIRFISVWLFWVVVGCAFCWMLFAIKYRMNAKGGLLASLIAIFIGFAMGGGVSYFPNRMKYLLWLTFVPIGCFSAALLLRFVWIFSDPSKPKSGNTDVLCFFIFPITFSYVSLGIAGMRMMFPKRFVRNWIARQMIRRKLFRGWIVRRKARRKSLRRKSKSGS